MKFTRKQLSQIIKEAPVLRNKKYSLLEACGCGAAPEPEMIDVVDDHSVEVPTMDHTTTGIDGMNPRDAFMTGFVMGQSGDFDDLFNSGVSDALAGGDNLENPIDYAMMTSGESNAGPHSLVALEENTFLSSDEIESALVSTLASEGGAADISVLRSAVNDLDVPENFDLESFLTNSGEIDKLPDGDYVTGATGGMAEAYGLPERQALGPAFVDVQPMLIGKPTIETAGLSQTDLWARMAGIKN
jgi:hypothetical protein